MIGGADRLLVVLHDDDGVAQVPHGAQRVEQLPVVPLVQADRRLVEDVQDAGEPRADLGRQPDALPLPPRQGGGGARQRQVAETDVEQEAEPLADLLQDLVGDLPVLVGQAQIVERLHRVLDRQTGVVGDVVAGDPDRQRLRLETRPLARPARLERHVALDLLPQMPCGSNSGCAPRGTRSRTPARRCRTAGSAAPPSAGGRTAGPGRSASSCRWSRPPCAASTCRSPRSPRSPPRAPRWTGW